MSQKYSKKYQKTVPETIIVGLFSIIWFLIKLPFRSILKNKKISQEEKNEIIAKCHSIEELLQSQNEIELKHAVMEADKLVDQVFKLKNYPGGTFADRLRSAEKHIDCNLYQQIWQGHKIRNQIAHEDGKIENKELKLAAEKLLKYVKRI